MRDEVCGHGPSCTRCRCMTAESLGSVLSSLPCQHCVYDYWTFGGGARRIGIVAIAVLRDGHLAARAMDPDAYLNYVLEGILICRECGRDDGNHEEICAFGFPILDEGE
jgi:hypothetical protein